MALIGTLGADVSVAPNIFKFKVPPPDNDPVRAADPVVTQSSDAVVGGNPYQKKSAHQLLSAIWRSDNRIHQLGTLDRQNKKFKNLHVNDVTAAEIKAMELSAGGSDAYVAMAEYKNAFSRCADNAIGTYAFWADIDVGVDKAAAGKGYATIEEAQQALAKFCSDTGLPMPTHIVASGGGLHCYWVLDSFVERETWQAYAAKLKTLTHSQKFLADDSRTSDIASVLRVPGTLNFKYAPPRPVDLLQALDEFINTATFLTAITAAHDLLCPVAVPKAVSTTTTNSTVVEQTGNGFSWPPDMDRLSSALKTLTPDCDDAMWKFKRIAPLARAAQEFPEFSDALYKLARSWSSGKLSGTPSKAWTTPGQSNGLTGKEVFDDVWQRFLNVTNAVKRTTVGTIYHEAKEAGWTYVRNGVGQDDGEEFEQCETTRIESQGQQLPTVVKPTQSTETAQTTVEEGYVDSPPDMLILNDQFAFIEENGSIYRLEFGNFIDPTKFKLQHDNRKTLIHSGGTQKSVGLGSAWLTSALRRQHKSLVIRPGEGEVTKDNCLNEWTGFAIGPAPGSVKPFLRLLVRLVPNRTARRYIQKWLAHLLQRPNIKIFVSLALWSHAQGVGKNLLFECLVEIIGTTHATIIGQDELTGAFNSWANRRVFVVGDEVSGSDKRQQNDKIKGLITGTTLSINEKYQPQRDVPNLLNFVFLSNHHDALFVSDGDRRFFVWEVEAGQLPQSQVDRFIQWRDSGGLAHLHHLLLHYPLGDFNPRAPAPMTSAKQQMTEDNRSDLEAWLADMMASDVTQVFGRELATATEIGKQYELDTGHKSPSSKAIVGACKRLGAFTRAEQVRVAKNKKIRPLALVRVEHWKTQPESAWAAEMAKDAPLEQ